MIITLIGFVAGALTMLAFLPQIVKTLKMKEAKDISLGLAVFNATAAGLWTTYGILVMKWPLIVPNVIASGLGITFLALKLRYNSGVTNREMAVVAVALAAILIGVVATVFTSLSLVSFVSSSAVVFAPLSFLTQVIKTWKLKETKDISLGMYVIFWVGVVLWLTYGLLLGDSPVVINNIIMVTLTSIMLLFKLRYK